MARKIVYKSSQIPGISERETRHLNRIRSLAADCMVLLKNDGTLPLKEVGNIALFGSGGRNTVRGGGGSGTTCPRFTRSVEEGLEELGFTVTTKDWLTRQDTMLKQAKEARDAAAREATGDELAAVTSALMDSANPDREELITEADIAASGAKTAIYVLARNAGEGSDRTPTEGDWLLLEDEKRNLAMLTAHYERVVVILNTCGVLSMDYLQNQSGVNSILSMGQQGSVGGLTVADVLTGKRYPSGKLCDTWAASYDDYSTAKNFAYMPSTDDVNYEEGIYVGYRYFDTFGLNPVYPFGYGLGYTTFAVETKELAVGAEAITVSVEVTNTGDTYSGREVVQVYASAPAGTVEKPWQVLVGFGKTAELAPGEKQTVCVTFHPGLMGSYDSSRAAWVLEKGDYYLRVGTSSRSTAVAAKLVLDEDVIVRQLKNLFHDDEPCTELSSAGAVPYTYDGEAEEKAAAPVYALAAADFVTKTAEYPQPQELKDTHPDHVITAQEVLDGKYTLDELVAQLTVEEMAAFTTGNGIGLECLFDASHFLVPGSAAQTTDICLESRGILEMPCSDGPAGLHVDPEFVVYDDGSVQSVPTAGSLVYTPFDHSRDDHIVEHHYQYCTAFPAASTLAQSWDPEVLSACGDMYGIEMKEVGMPIALKPSMNIHRDPLGGRNFEYYSEDPLLSGVCAAADILALQKHPGIGSTIKHFAVNNQERNRFHTMAHVSERAIREIYLRGFEIACRTAQPACIMTSYNMLNGWHTANNHDLLTEVCRNEWGYQGMIMTDWFTTNSTVDVFSAVREDEPPRHGLTIPHLATYAGNDIIMPGSPEDRADIAQAVKDGTTKLADLQRCAKNVIGLILRTEVYPNSVSYYKHVAVEPAVMHSERG